MVTCVVGIVIKIKENKMINWIKEKLSRTTKKIDDYQVGLTFAEAGEYEMGREMVEEREVLLVVGYKGTFSQEIIAYAIDMAQRMNYEILALSTSDLSCDSISLFPASKQKLCDEFDALAEENSKTFASWAQKSGIKFNHTIQYSDVDAAIANINKKITKITFVVDEQLPESGLFVYSIV
jgi:hypothetical protein